MKKSFYFDFPPKSIHLFQLIFPIVYPFAIHYQKISLPGEQAIDADLSHVYCSSEFGLAQIQIVTIAQNPFGKGGSHQNHLPMKGWPAAINPTVPVLPLALKLKHQCFPFLSSYFH